MRRGDIVTVAFAGDFGKPRPAVIVQSDYLNDTHATILLCPFTSELVDAPLIRIPCCSFAGEWFAHLLANHGGQSGAGTAGKNGPHIGVLDPGTLVQLDRSLAVVFGLVS